MDRGEEYWRWRTWRTYIVWCFIKRINYYDWLVTVVPCYFVMLCSFWHELRALSDLTFDTRDNHCHYSKQNTSMHDLFEYGEES